MGKTGVTGIEQACLRPRDRFWDIPVPKIDSAFDNLLVPQPSWSPSTTQQLRKLVAAPYLAPNDWTPRSEAYFVFPLAQGTPGKQCGLAATGVYQPSLRSPWLAAIAVRVHSLTAASGTLLRRLVAREAGTAGTTTLVSTKTTDHLTGTPTCTAKGSQ
ncbi:hypothetical protein [Thiolapillus sp.]|uniref:hypothetical protein n=2 Tax=Thiolapillus sp. TaxID=2017437 RepID=UPI0027399B2E|nr:hypothetical protein [Thiolapillus sp.]